jgi:hypothetical protein
MCDECCLTDVRFRRRCQHVLATLQDWRNTHGRAWMPLWRLHRQAPWRTRALRDVLDALRRQRLIGYRGFREAVRADDFYRLQCSDEAIAAHAEAGLVSIPDVQLAEWLRPPAKPRSGKTSAWPKPGATPNP